MLSADKDFEGKSKKTCVKKDFKNNGSNKRAKYIIYKINGYWFRLSRMNWSSYRCIRYSTIVSRCHTGKTPGQVLGFEELKSTRPMKLIGEK